MLVSGPSSLTRLEKDDKVIYLFSDAEHIDSEITGCEDSRALDIHQYLIRELLETQDPYDLFITELWDNYNIIKNPEPLNLRDATYMAAVTRALVKLGLGKKLSNNRLHIIKPYSDNAGFVSKIITTNMYHMPDKLVGGELNEFLNDVDRLLTEISLLKDVVKGEPITHVPANELSITGIKNVKNNIAKLFQAKDERLTIFLKKSKEIIIKIIDEIIADLKHVIQNAKKLNGKGLYQQMDDIRQSLDGLHDRLALIAILRRIIDKDYIKKSVVFIHASQASMLLGILLLEFGFKVTQSTLGTTKEITKMYDQGKLFEEMLKTQCIDMSKFPKHLK